MMFRNEQRGLGRAGLEVDVTNCSYMDAVKEVSGKGCGAGCVGA